MFDVLVLGSFFIKIIFNILFTFSFTINLKSVRLAVQFKFIFMVFGLCKKCVDILLSISLSIGILNQNRYQPAQRSTDNLTSYNL
ncbi:hypothetical protein Hanom_Chr09g00815891 [Helianthus anomalus]